jgi:nucleotide-binding universal stress UspA family protein
VKKRIVIAVDATQRSLDALALGKLLADATTAPVGLVSVFPYDPLVDPEGEGLTGVRADARDLLLELANEAGLDVADAEVIASNRAARELQHVTERETTGIIVVGSTGRGSVGRLFPGSVGQRLLTGSASPVAIAPRDYAEHPAARLELIGVAFDDSPESHHALEAGRLLARSAGAQLRVIAAFQPQAFGAMGTFASGGASVNDQMRRELQRALDEALSEEADGGGTEGRFLEGSAGEVLAKESADLDLLVTGSRGYGPRAAVLLGSTTHALMRSAACPALITPRQVTLDLGQEDGAPRRPG